MPNSDGDYFVEEKTEVIYGTENIINSTLEQWLNLNHFADVCTDYNGPSMFVIPNHPITKAFQRLKDRGIKLRFIAEINKENLQHCKELMKVCELHHLDEIKGNFGLGDGIYYRASAKTIGSSPPPLLISSTLRAFVEQQYFFDMLWKKAIPAKQRIKEIEQGIRREFIDTIQDPYETQKILDSLLKSVTEEILIILPTTTATNKRLSRYEQEYLLHLLKNAAEHGVKIRILVDPSTKEMIRTELLLTNNSDLVEIHLLDNQQQNKVMTVIVDKELCLTAEVKENDDNMIMIIMILLLKS